MVLRQFKKKQNNLNIEKLLYGMIAIATFSRTQKGRWQLCISIVSFSGFWMKLCRRRRIIGWIISHCIFVYIINII